MEYELHRSKRKTVSMSITKELKVKVRAPLKMPQKVIENFINKHLNWIEEQKKAMKKKLDSPLNREFSEKEVKKLKSEARELITNRVKFYSEIMGVIPANVKITSATTRWGSCSGKNSLCFTFRLIQYPIEVIDYIVVHELAHIKVKNHSDKFYDFVREIMPDYKDREALLKADLKD